MLSDTDQHEFVTASCEGKPSFPSFALAEKVAKRGEDDHTLPETVRFVIALLLGHPEAPQ